MRRLFYVVMALAMIAGCKQSPAPQATPTPPLLTFGKCWHCFTPTPRPSPTHSATPTPVSTALPTLAPTAAPTMAPTLAPPIVTPTPLDPPPIGGNASNTTTGNGSASGIQATARPTPTPTPTSQPTNPPVIPYAPAYLLVGSGGGGSGGNECGGSPGTWCITGSQLTSLHVRYAEAQNGSNPTQDNLCGTTAAQFCLPIRYIKLNNIACSLESAAENSIYNALDSHDALASDPGFTHAATPAPAATPPYWASQRTGQSPLTVAGTLANCAHNTKGTYEDPANVNSYLSTAFNTYYFGQSITTGAVPNPFVGSRFDNQSLVDRTLEYLDGSFAAIQNYTINAGKFFGLFNYPIGINGGGAGGSFYAWNSFTGDHLSFSCNNGVCNDWDDYCTYAGSHLSFDQFERPVTQVGGSGTNPGTGLPYPGYAGATVIGRNLPYILNTLSHVYSDAGCANLDPVFLDEPQAPNVGHIGNSGDDRFLRDDNLALRLLAEPGNYTGAFGDRTAVGMYYNDCSNSCTNQVGIYVENGIQAIPLDTGMARSTTAVNDGNGCTDTTGGASATNPTATPNFGGAQDVRVFCDLSHSDIAGSHGVVYARAFECYKFGVDRGPCVLLFNLAHATEAIQPGWCHVGGLLTDCSAYPFYWHYNGTGPENCYEDIGNGTGCAGGFQICPLSNGCNGSWGELAWNGTATLPFDSSATTLGANTLGECPSALDSAPWNLSPSIASPTYQAEDCGVLLMSQ